MYPDWPESAADLVPMPRCDGPKLEPFDFQGQQNMEFLEYLGEGSHSHVFKVEIQGLIYALKLFRFCYDQDWAAPEIETDNREIMSAFYNYSEPFSCECRAFGRLQEAGYTELAVRCYGYLLLTEENERAMKEKFSHLDLEFNGNADNPGYFDMRSRFLGKDGKVPPIRGIVKQFGQSNENLRNRDARKILRDIIRFQQLGIIRLDVAHRQLISGKISDFSKAITTPHYMTTPELNPGLTPEWKSAMVFETFQHTLSDYWDFDEMIMVWNQEHEGKISACAFPGGRGHYRGIKYNLRSRPSRERVYSYVDPRLYDWKNAAGGPGSGNDAKKAVDGRKSARFMSKPRRRLDARPHRWYCDGADRRLKGQRTFSTSIGWEFRDGLIFPRKRWPAYDGEKPTTV
ncbi:Fc.00g043460.m01.CDS01 [Cosmosporella sp. VM-42]